MTNWNTITLGSFDLETTGVDVQTARIVSYSMLLRGPGVHETHTAILNPGIEIPEGAAEIHGITTERAVAEGLPYEEGVRQLVEIFRTIALDHPIVVFNACYDISLLYVEMARLGLGLIHPSTTIVDPFVLDKTFDKWRKGSRKLGDTAAHYGVTLDNAHDAVADTEAALDLARALLVKFGRGRSPRELHEGSKVWGREMQDSYRQHLIKKGTPKHIEAGWPIYDEARAHVKSLAA